MHPPLTAIVMVILCWVAWRAYWVVSARGVKPPVHQEPGARRLFTIVLTWGAALVVFVPMPGMPVFDEQLVPVSVALAWAGVAVCASGVAFSIWARRTLAGNWSGNVTLKADHELIRRGPYAFVRHPIYTGILVMLIGTAMLDVTLGRAAGVALALFAFGRKLLQEEALMIKHFPNDYPAYRATTWRLFPFVF